MNKPVAAAPPRPRDAAALLIEARKSFGLASQCVGAEEIELHARQGRDYLRRAHEAVELKDISPSFWRKTGLPNG
ncbi:MAG TPA: hypothetical protein VGC38_05660 [Pseudolabrys sp.]